MKITKIEKQKKNAGRYSLFIDDKFLMGIDEEVLIQFALNKNQEVDQSLISRIKEAEYHQKVYTRAINYLSYGMRSIKEMRDYLAKLEFDSKQTKDQKRTIDPQLIDKTIQRLIDQGYLNDALYGESYVRTSATLNRKGPKNIQQELIKKGLTQSEVEDALTEYPFEQIYENGVQLAEKYIRTKKKLPPKMMQNKLQQYLTTKGYTSDVIKAVVNEINIEQSEDETYELLIKEAETLFRKRSKRYEGLDLKQKITEGLLRKGFEFELINRWFVDNNQLFKLND